MLASPERGLLSSALPGTIGIAVADTTEEMILDEALRGMARQQSVIEGLRTRTGTLFAAASLVSAFLGGQVLTRHPNLDGLSWLAIGSFIACFLLVLTILWPWGFKFVLNPNILIEDHRGKTVPQLQVFLAKTWRKDYEWNQERVRWLHWVYRGALLSLAVEVVAWLMSLAR